MRYNKNIRENAYMGDTKNIRNTKYFRDNKDIRDTKAIRHTKDIRDTNNIRYTKDIRSLDFSNILDLYKLYIYHSHVEIVTKNSNIHLSQLSIKLGFFLVCAFGKV